MSIIRVEDNLTPQRVELGVGSEGDELQGRADTRSHWRWTRCEAKHNQSAV